MAKLISTTNFLKKKFTVFEFDGVWKDSFGCPEEKSRWLIYGKSGHGKTEFCVQLAKYMCRFGNVVYISREQGESESLQKAWKRNNCRQVRSKLKLAVEFDFNDILNLIKQRSKLSCIIIDSLDYIKLTESQYNELNEQAKKTMVVIVSWEKNGEPKTAFGEKLKYMVDMPLKINRFIVDVSLGRYEGAVPFVISEKKAKEYHAWLNR